jgi:RNA polymerase sigma factor (sigma-70 family)
LSEKNATKQGCDVPGDVQRATAVFSEHGEFIRGIIRLKIKDEGTAEDIFHDFFLSLVARPIPADVRDIKSYIYRSIINDVKDHVRRLGRYQTLTYKCTNFSKMIVNKRLPEDALIEKEQIDKMIELIKKRVTRNEYKAIKSRFHDDLSAEEAAGGMNIDGRSVVRYISTGLRKVKRFLAVEQEVKDDSTQY